MRLKLLTYNILHGGKGRSALLLDVLQRMQANVIILQEADQVETVEYFAQILKLNIYVASNIALLSQYPISAGYTYHSFPRIHDTMLEASLTLPSGDLLHVFGVHPIHYPGTILDYWRNWQLRIVRERAAAHGEKYCLIAGDFNAIAPADRFLIDKAPRQMRLLYWLQGKRIFTTAIKNMLNAGFADCYRQIHPQDDGFTIPTRSPKIRLDYIFANHLTARTLRNCVVITQLDGVNVASDHYPVMAEFEL